jgi:hypothetical protein
MGATSAAPAKPSGSEETNGLWNMGFPLTFMPSVRCSFGPRDSAHIAADADVTGAFYLKSSSAFGDGQTNKHDGIYRRIDRAPGVLALRRCRHCRSAQKNVPALLGDPVGCLRISHVSHDSQDVLTVAGLG